MKTFLALLFWPLMISAAPVKTIPLPVPADAHESVWTTALAAHLCVHPESPDRHVLYGRADVATAELVIEVDRLVHIHGALGQALHYRHGSGKDAVVALVIADPSITDAKSPLAQRVAYFAEIAAENDIALWVLLPKVQES